MRRPISSCWSRSARSTAPAAARTVHPARTPNCAVSTRVSRKRVARLMRQAGLVGRSRHRTVRTTWPDRQAATTDLVQRQFRPPRINQLWVADITYVRTLQGWLYLAVVLDACSRRVVGWALADQQRSELACAALRMALLARRPAAGLIHHSDRGSVYVGAAYRRAAGATWGVAQRWAPRDRLGQCRGRIVLRDLEARTGVSGGLANAAGGAHGDLRVHRGLVQPCPAALHPGLPITTRMRVGAALQHHLHTSVRTPDQICPQNWGKPDCHRAGR